MAEYPEIITSCADKYIYSHETACCYRADILSVENDGTYTIEWTETVPEEETSQVSGVKTSYGCGWCLAPFLIGHEIKPFCPGFHVMVLDNQAITDRYLIIGFDAKYYSDTELLKPCIPDNLGFYFSNSRYGVPYFTEDVVDGQTICSPITTWTEGNIELPRGTENDSGKIITIATSAGEITAIKPFQVPGFDIIAGFLGSVTEPNKNYVTYISDNNKLVALYASAGVYPKAYLNVSASIYCLGDGSSKSLTHSATANSINYPTAFLGNQSYLQTGADWVNYPGAVYPAKTLSVVINNSGIITSICLANDPHIKIVVTPGEDLDGSNIYTSQITYENVGSFSMSCEEFQPATNHLYNGFFFEPNSDAGSRSYSISGTCSLFDNGDGFTGSQTVSMSGDSTQSYSDDENVISGALVSSDNYSIDYSFGSFRWTNSMNSDLDISVVTNSEVVNRTDNSTFDFTETRYYICAQDIKSNTIVYLKQVVTLNWQTSGTISLQVGIGWPWGNGQNVNAEYSGSCTEKLVMWTPQGEKVLYSETFDCQGLSAFSYLFYKYYLPDEATTSNSFFDQGILGIVPSGSHALIIQYYDEFFNVWGVHDNTNDKNPVVTITSCLDGRQLLIESTIFGISKYFVDNVERFLKEDPNNWTSTDILNR